ncbi:hypothetical protein SPRG_03986 [Saprolegnia parasitica CBS 223.65]|uniref:PWI domain-containing protein n=1 Tax=Saprolegnia parasitica (strain CBS 223.65) TaxID=695850 RepID=A0A067CKX7_SAPPC|nr:hypothetical protein SPRG_03986 [Saprolegnia parasitica CBS 223.65]KDO31369.1 hypothetical protein SPRG_03986 [Saprolegnia parasitica CBS 223.65]|eukprot:XP_012197966.1 hypothetical protein SPRG_03986 [Saprolegnia parasitica CBS 223.65]
MPPETGPLNVFVGKLPPDLHDNYIRGLLDRVGTVVAWKRTTDPISGKPKGFGYCTFSGGLDVIRALKLLDGFSIDSKNILLKVDTTTQARLDEYWNAIPIALRIEEERKNERVADILQRLYEERSSLHGGYNNDIASWGDLVSVDAPEVKEQVRGGMIMNEVEKFRLAQEERTQQLEAKRLKMIQERLRQEKEDKEKEAVVEATTAATPPAPEEKKPERDRSRSTGRRDRRDRDRRDSRRRSRSRSRERTRTRRSRSRSRDRRRDRRNSAEDSPRPKPTKEPEPAPTPAAPASVPPPPPPPPKPFAPLKKIELKLSAKKDPKDAKATGAAASTPVFAVEDDAELKPQRAYVPLDYSEEERRAALIDAQVARSIARINSRTNDPKSIVERIPKDTKGLFKYPLDWAAVDKHGVVSAKMAPWVEKKVAEYLGEADAALVSFIVTQLTGHASPSTLIDGLSPVLEADAEPFVVSLWRRLVFEAISADVGRN